MNQAATLAMKRIDRTSNIIFWILLASIVLMSGAYVYFINKTVRNVVYRQNLQAEIASLNSKLSETEFAYINAVGSITLETAHQLGFVAPSASDKTFVTRETLGQNVAIR